jgi:hypothetical protein
MTVATAVDKLALDSPKTGRVARGIRVVAQRLYHRVITPKGTLTYSKAARSFGFDIAGKLGQVGESRAKIAATETGLVAQLKEDSAVRTATVNITRHQLSGIVVRLASRNWELPPLKESWRVEIEATTREGDIRLILDVSGVSAQLLSLEDLSS